MKENACYFPALTTRAAEIKALSKLAGPTKDLIFPLVRLQAWPRSRKENPVLVARSLQEFIAAFDGRPAALDLSAPRQDRESDDALQGRREIEALHDATGGFRAWVDLIKSSKQFTPTVLWSDDASLVRAQVEALASLDRGLVFRLHQSEGWNIDKLALLAGMSFRAVPILVFVDCGQISRLSDLTVLALSVQGALVRAQDILKEGELDFVVAGSSFPSTFSDIDPKRAEIEIRERRIFSLLRDSGELLRGGIKIKYGDHASVYAAFREQQFRGLPRVDYPGPVKWIYHRRSSAEGFCAAAAAIVAEPEWNNELLCWGAQEIRRAASGDGAGLGSASSWTAIRINVHLHQQAHFGAAGAPVIEELWKD